MALSRPTDQSVASGARELAFAARREILHMTSKAKASHVASALSVVDILATLYSGAVDISPKNQDDPHRDIVILSKGHAAAAIYSVLALKDFFPKEWLDSYCQDSAPLGGHVTFKGVPGVELSTGSLGHGLPYGLGTAFSRKRFNQPGRTIVIMSDGECDEGTTWESALLANHHNLNNLCVVVDRNRIQSLTYTEDTLRLEPFADKWMAFGWDTRIVNGHDYAALTEALKPSNRPICIIAETTKGKGVDFMEDTVLWHYRPPNEEELASAISSLEDGTR
jgi:transketolase